MDLALRILGLGIVAVGLFVGIQPGGSLSGSGQSVRTVPAVKGLASRPKSAPEPASTIRFENVIDRSGIQFVLRNSITPQRYYIETMIGGAAVFDYNNDGLLDIYFPNGARIPDMDKSDPSFHNRLYRNNGDGSFADVTERAGLRGSCYSNGVAVGDYDNDGYEDLYVAGFNCNQLFHNNGDGTFTDVTEKAGVAGIHPKYGKTWAITAGWFDYNNDGYLDLFVNNYLKYSLATAPRCKVREYPAYCSPENFEALPNVLYRNNGDGTFTDVSEESQIAKQAGKGMGIAFADYDGDGFTDVFVSNDSFRNFLFHNNGNGTFDEVALLSGVAYNENGTTVAGMGADFRDLDNDGRPDIFHTAMWADTFPLYRNLGNYFDDITSSSGMAVLSRPLTAWGTGAFDFDNDGFKDLFAACSAILDNSEEIEHRPFKLPNSVFRNFGDGTFADVGPQAGPSFNVPEAHRGAAFGDFDNDGKIDVAVVVLNGRPQLFLNRSTNNNHWLLIKLVGTKSNRDGLGAHLKITLPDGKSQYNEATTAIGYNSSSDKRVHFGLGSATSVERIEIAWPSGIKQTLTHVAADQILTVREPEE